MVFAAVFAVNGTLAKGTEAKAAIDAGEFCDANLPALAKANEWAHCPASGAAL